MQILGFWGMYFDAVVVKVKTFLFFFRLALTILCCVASCFSASQNKAFAYKNRIYRHFTQKCTKAKY